MFKAGDKITPKNTRENRNDYPFIEVGQTYTVKDCDERFVRLENVISGHFVSRFELVEREPTPQELADKYRECVKNMREARDALIAMGFELKAKGRGRVTVGVIPINDYFFEKAETTVTTL